MVDGVMAHAVSGGHAVVGRAIYVSAVFHHDADSDIQTWLLGPAGISHICGTLKSSYDRGIIFGATFLKVATQTC